MKTLIATKAGLGTRVPKMPASLLFVRHLAAHCTLEKPRTNANETQLTTTRKTL